MRSQTAVLLLAFSAVPAWSQQDTSQLSPRTLFYREQPDSDKLPVAPPVKPPKPPQPSSNGRKSASEPKADSNPKQASNSASPVVPAVEHLGLRYNLLLVNSRNGAVEAVDPDRVLNPGDCVALEFEPNRSGYLYVFEQASSGNWQPLFPSAALAGESNVVRSHATLRVPAKDCFEVSGPTGQERVFAVLSRNVEDVRALNDSMKAGSEGSPRNAIPHGPEPDQPVLVTELLDNEIARYREGLKNRELRLKKVAEPEALGEMPNSVYVVNASQAPSDRIVTEIPIQHR